MNVLEPMRSLPAIAEGSAVHTGFLFFETLFLFPLAT